MKTEDMEDVRQRLPLLEAAFPKATETEKAKAVRTLATGFRGQKNYRNRKGNYRELPRAILESFQRLGSGASGPLQKLSTSSELKKDEEWRAWILEAVGATGDPSAVNFLLKHLQLLEAKPVAGAINGLSWYGHLDAKKRHKILTSLEEFERRVHFRVNGGYSQGGGRTRNPRQSKSSQPYSELKNACRKPLSLARLRLEPDTKRIR